MNAAIAVAPALDWPCLRSPWPWQAEAFQRTNSHNGFMLAMPMGGGKSAVAIAAAERDQAQRVLVLCPKSVVGVWPNQLREHSPRDWTVWAGEAQGARGPLANPSVPRRAEALINATKHAITAGRPLCAVVNYEAAPVGDMGNLLLGTDWDVVIVDESHRIKAPGGKQSRFVGRLCRRTRLQGGRVLLLTGTPMPHSPLDLYGQFRALDENLLGTSYASFRAYYGAPRIKYRHADGTPVYLTTPGGQLIYDGVRDDRADELTDRVADRMYQVDAAMLDEQLGLIPPRDVYRTVQLEAATRRAYQDLERDLIARVNQGVVTAANAMVLVLRLAQTTNGFAVDADTGHVHQLASPPEKARLLADILQDLPQDEPVVVFARFHHDLNEIERVTQAAGRTYGELSGRRRDGLTDTSTMNPDIHVLGAQIRSGGVGIDLTRARYAVYYSLGFELADYLQSRKRLHRPGQDGQVTYIHLLAESTVDEAIYGALRRREEIVNAVLARLKGATP